MTKDFSQASTHPDKVRPSSAISRWSMDSADVSNGKILDSWGSNDGTINGASTGASGVGGSEAFSFDGTDDYVDIGGSSSLRPTNVTLSAWLKYGTGRAAGNEGDYTGYLIYGSGTAKISDGSTDYATSKPIPDDGNWHHVVAVYKDSDPSLAVYHDGVKVEQISTGSKANATNPFVLGKYAAGNSAYFSGSIDEVRVYSEALTQQQVWKLYNIGRNANWGYSRS